MAADETPTAETGGDVSTTAQPLHPVTHWEQLNEQEEAENNDADSVISNPAESTASMTSSILSYRTIQGRTFHSERGNAQYWAANDEQQNESMDIVHHFLSRLLDDKLFLSPLKDNIQSALDIGTGTEHVLMLTPGSDFADQFPSAKVVGTDISPIQPSWVPPNLEFHIDDCTQPWTFAPDSIDFVHMRYLFGSIKDWSALFKEAFRACRPGGWVESHEASAMMESDDGTVTDTSAMHEWGRFFIEGGKKMGQPCTIIEDDLQQKCMREAGFEDIHIADYKVRAQSGPDEEWLTVVLQIAIGGWSKDKKMREIGQYVLAALEQDFEGYVLYMASQLLGWSMQEVKVYCAQLRRELRSTANHPFFRYRAVYGRKPQAS
ncbi:methyltransferase [Fusarium subglutinans]|uniref:Methyltransferase n=1 Tax=Gibberella subglutinans TaxID=42677 RepID=A0A8H5ULR7_GIBSU|nr:methyltransferase [Fusarium subglutinans]KAF5591379.1 methyltransferase [Fusarium subglutinans]